MLRQAMSTSLISALLTARIGQMQLAVAARLSRTDPNNPDSGPSIAKLVDAAQQNFEPLADAASGIGANLDITA